MKKVILIALVLLTGIVAKSQNIPATNMRVTLSDNVISGVTFDTVTSSTARYLYANPIKSFKDVVSIVATVTEVSDTTAATISLETSIDGSNWYPYYNSRDSTYTFSPADEAGSQSYRWNLINWADSYLRVKCVGTATPNFILTAKYQAYNER